MSLFTQLKSLRGVFVTVSSGGPMVKIYTPNKGRDNYYKVENTNKRRDDFEQVTRYIDGKGTPKPKALYLLKTAGMRFASAKKAAKTLVDYIAKNNEPRGLEHRTFFDDNGKFRGALYWTELYIDNHGKISTIEQKEGMSVAIQFFTGAEGDVEEVKFDHMRDYPVNQYASWTYDPAFKEASAVLGECTADPMLPTSTGCGGDFADWGYEFSVSVYKDAPEFKEILGKLAANAQMLLPPARDQ